MRVCAGSLKVLLCKPQEELGQLCVDLGFPKYRGKQLYEGILNGARSFQGITNVSITMARIETVAMFGTYRPSLKTNLSLDFLVRLEGVWKLPVHLAVELLHNNTHTLPSKKTWCKCAACKLAMSCKHCRIFFTLRSSKHTR